MGDWLFRLAQASDGVLLLTAAAAVFAVVMGFSGLRRARLIEDVPTARVRSAPQGYFELIGKARALDGEPIMAPLSHTACCWYRYRVDARTGKNWRTVKSGTSDGIFVLRDETGDCIVDPEGAEVTTRHEKAWSDSGSGWGGHGVHLKMPSIGKTADMVVDLGGTILDGINAGTGQYRYSESVILDGDPLYVVGQFHTLGAGDQTSTLRELTGAILREWKRAPDTLRERFDSNRDGKIDSREWERAREVAEREAAVEHADNLKRDQLHTIARPADGRHFLLSNLEQFGLLKRYRWRMRLGFGLFVLLGGAVAFMWSARL